MRGKPRTPTAVLKLRGSWRAAKREAREPKADGPIPPPGKWMRAPDRDAYRRVVERLQSAGIGSSLDAAALERYACLLMLWREAYATLKRDGVVMVMQTERGEYRQQRPEVGILNKLSAELRAIEDRFGLSPSARARLAGDDKAAPADPGEQYFEASG